MIIAKNGDRDSSYNKVKSGPVCGFRVERGRGVIKAMKGHVGV